MSEIINSEQGTQQGGDQQPISKKTKRDLETMEGMEEKEKEAEKDKVDKEKKTPTISTKYNSDDADIGLISSDNVLFKVHSYRLMTASSIFRDMLSRPDSAARKAPIYLTDEKLETANVLENLLDTMYTLKTANIDALVMFAVLDLADKWDFDHVRYTIRRDLSHHNSNEYMFHHFALSIKFQDPSLIAGFPRRKHDVNWANSPTGSAVDKFREKSLIRQVYDEASPGLLNEDVIGRGRVFDPATWPYGDFLFTPPTVLWALLRATYVGTIVPAKIDSDKVADEFERLLKLAYEPKKADVDKDKGDGGN